MEIMTSSLLKDSFSADEADEKTPLVVLQGGKEREKDKEREKEKDLSNIAPELSDFSTDEPVTEELFDMIVSEIRYAISRAVYPTMISQGSSGSYFCRDRHGKILAVFKPKTEEPYGQLNPKWTKWLQRTCCPCCFGRGCLIPNTGYLSEASASVVDRKLGLNIVPRTQIISLSSPTFYYKFFDRRRKPLPEKVGSLQVFVRGYRDASVCIREFQTNPLSDELKHQFRLEFERLVILDYLTRNTDRGNDNWLIKVHPGGPEKSNKPFLKIAAIDNGLSFPFKHPDSWRAYPFGWAVLAASEAPFSDETKNAFLPKLIDPDWTDDLLGELKKIAQVDPDFSEKQFNRQAAVIRGQLFNLVEALMKQYTPLELIRMTPITIRHVEGSNFRRRLMSLRLTSPFFSNC